MIALIIGLYKIVLYKLKVINFVIKIIHPKIPHDLIPKTHKSTLSIPHLIAYKSLQNLHWRSRRMQIKIISTPRTISQSPHPPINCCSMWFINRKTHRSHRSISKMPRNHTQNHRIHQQSSMEFYTVKRLLNGHDSPIGH